MPSVAISLIDTHCHLSDLSPDDLAATIHRAQIAGVTRFIAIGAGYGIDDNGKALTLAKTHNNIFCALGTHPHDAKLANDGNCAELENLSRDPRVVAIGEIGLDYHYMNSDRDVQHDVLRRFVRIAKSVKKPIVIHDRDCGEEIPDILTEENAREVGGVVHCFSGGAALAKRYLDLGFYVSFSGIITFKKADELREVAKTIPSDRLLVETDAPFLAPMPHRGKPNEPGFVKLVAEKLAELRGVSLEEIADITTKNAEKLFRLNSI